MTDTRLPPPGTVVRRKTARVLPVRPDGKVLLLHGWDPLRPQTPYWFTIGGGVEPGETVKQAGIRELPEEVGILLPPDQLGEPVATNEIEFEWGGCPIIQHQTFFAVGVDAVEVSFANQEQLELETISDHGWWHPDELEATGQAAHITIPNLLRQAVEEIRYREAS
ncbi:8-oxo-dGTP pyrophosphatase MutT (NUDIX family) [Kribbella orskensis]|uniref:8-oxo-dGTP pyrophosphatase MutT (NUDIX family) n=1 Tax=Kribbella orskensis TaxID=2512216 RepID=A0ABY2BVY1_9ACTN|nr:MULTISPECIES: NUDIX domain-containing protein [Kribbella]TCN42671.1 8-oxo-dGTP pyrophosphatase MutT (NUDIX family) [Kribbella sp. VKM Ac-2500]TCO29973.1 8-oxo-dGTP pyrophosphatase MutT (NUDIX family) [Kribbella orskensis]